MPYRFEITYQGQQVYQIVVYDLYHNMIDCWNTTADSLPKELEKYLIK